LSPDASLASAVISDSGREKSPGEYGFGEILSQVDAMQELAGEYRPLGEFGVLCVIAHYDCGL
jgi:hypothetical protein